MRSRWSDKAAAEYPGPLGLRVYTSRLLGAETALVMHGGGNTSVKLTEPDLFGQPVDLLYVKGSGSDLDAITEQGFAPVRLDHLLRLAQLDELTDAQMAEHLRLACTRADAPAPSVEAILHAILPARYVDHTHADAVLSITNTPSGRKRIEELYGDRVVVIDYVMPGFALARRCAQEFPARRSEATVGMILMNHGVFSFGETAREAYELMIELVTMAEEYLQSCGAWVLPTVGESPDELRARRKSTAAARAAVRAEISTHARSPMILTTTCTPRTAAFLARDDHAELAARGPLTPDHVIRTKRVPLIGRDVAAYATEYERYFERNANRSRLPLTMLDPAPRVVVDRELGVMTAGRTARDAVIAADIVTHTLDAIERATLLDEWQALGEGHLFDVEYWELEQAKLKRQGAPPPLAGEIALVTGAASGIGQATASALLRAGAAVVGLDIDTRIEDRAGESAFLGIHCDVTDEGAVEEAVASAVDAFGGLDILVLNAGVFPPSMAIDALPLEEWRRVMAVNVDANLTLLRLTGDLLARAPRFGRVIVNASKNVHAPGPGAAAYSASKASLTQLARVAALEWAPRGVRVNLVHPNAVFDTGIWDSHTLQSRAASYNLSVEDYKRNNLLRVEITSADVADVIVSLATTTFAKTTGAQIPIDGGNERVV
jgi:rhamnose utilization protein RhaD (predicted bifunctional aldolase and dehydrogenase)/NAD(P)-dependent dehydrogenase (short-subunit alcohol dehydrogenase family)